MEILNGGLGREDVAALLRQHLSEMADNSPPESIHALDLSALQTPDISFYTMRSASEALMGCAALKALNAQNGEIKSMRTADRFRRQGVASRLLAHLIHVAAERGYQSLWLETGSMDAFLPARQMYSRHGFVECAPFGGYVADPNSVFLTLALRD